MILIGLGANLSSRQFGPPRATLGAALERLQAHGIVISRRSPWYRSAPVPVSDQPWYVNGVALVTTRLSADELLETLLMVEAGMGRRRSEPNAPRILDLDLLAYDQLSIDKMTAGGIHVTVPHPRMTDRAFVMLPLADIAPAWRHPKSMRSLADFIEALPPDQSTEPMADASGLFGTEWQSPEN